ncbi:MAG: SUMF1/EgtB/PvdO family nonheme iron enzyme [Candidatus Binatia bacterium]
MLHATTLALGVLAASADAAVLCQKRSGAVFVRTDCKKKETAIDLTQFGAAPPDTPDQVRAKFFAGSACSGADPQEVMVKVGNVCVDVYEASVWSTPTGGTQYGVAAADYPCGGDGNDCTGIFARSVPDVLPARYVTWFQAQQACRNSGKRLLTNAEWQMAASGTPDPGLGGNGTTYCNTNTAGPRNATAAGACVSSAGVRDMVGNVEEWVADWMPFGTGCPGWGIGPGGGTFTDDIMCMVGADGTRGPGVLVRGGYYNEGTDAGVFTILSDYLLQYPEDSHGFRCAR